ncbi:MAG: alpha/beta hydrolase [Spirochaetia bacterium]|nr:alpha/beta hydrolase [Spirochaetia bacterium]
MNAPDFPADEFRAKAADIRHSAKRVTLYCSPGDNALKASERVNQNSRIGSCGKVDGIDVINVNEVDSPALGIGGLGHGYYAGRPIMTDIFQVILGMDTSKRLFIRKSADSGGENFVLRR